MYTNKTVLERAALFARIRAGRQRDDRRAALDAVAALTNEIADIVDFQLLTEGAAAVLSRQDLCRWWQILGQALVVLDGDVP
jgi:hypothetical protein